MKRFVSIIVTLAMLLCCCNASASVSLFYDVMSAACYSVTSDSQVSVKLNRPLAFLNTLDDGQRKYLEPVDIKQLAESAIDFDSRAVSSATVDPSYLKARASVETQVDLPLEFNDNLRADVSSHAGVWVDWDVTDINKPMFDIIIKAPYSDDYIVTDFTDFIKSGADFQPVIECLRQYGSGKQAEELNKYLLDLVKKHCTIKETRTSMEYSVSADDAGVKAIFAGIMEKSIEISKETLGNKANDTFDSDFYDWYNDLGEKLNSIPLIGSEGLNIKVEIRGKKLVSVQSDIHVCFNIYDIIKAYDGDVVELNRDDWYVDFVLSTKTSYDNYNENVEVVFPEITDENSISLSDINNYFLDVDGEVLVNTAYPVSPDAEGMFMLPLRDCLASAGVTAEEYIINGDVISVTPVDENSGFSQATIEVGSNKIFVNGSEKTLAHRVERNPEGLILVSADIIGYLTNSVINRAKFYSDKSVIYYEKNEADTAADMDALIDYEGYLPEDGTFDGIEEEDVYISPRVSLSGTGKPVIINGVLYVPFVAVMNEYDVQDVVYDSGVVTANAPDVNPKEFSSITLVINSNVVTVDSVQHSLANPVIAKDGSTYVPEEFFELINSRVHSLDYYYGSDSSFIVIYRTSYDSYTNYLSQTMNIYVESAGGVIRDDSGYYLPLRNIMGQLKIRDENIVVDGEKATITAHDSISGFEKITIDGVNVDIDGTVYTLDNVIKNIDGVTYVPEQFITDVFGGSIQNVSVDYSGEKPLATYLVEINNMNYQE